MSKSQLSLDFNCRTSKENGETDDFEDKMSSNCSEQTQYIINQVLQRVEKSHSRRRRLPFVEEEGRSYDDYINNLVNFIEDKMYLIEDLYSGNHEYTYKAVKCFRMLLTYSPNGPINEVIELGLLPKFVDCLKSPERMLQYEAAWLITNITYCSSIQTRFIIESGVVDALVKLLWTECETVQTQAAWALGNIAGDGDEFRDHLISKGAIPGVVHVMKSIESEKMLLTCSWVLENLCAGSKDTAKLIQVLPVLQEFMSHSNTELLCKCLNVLKSLTAHKQLVRETIRSDIFSNVLELLDRKDDVTHYALQIFANIVHTGDEHVIRILLESELLSRLSKLMQAVDICIQRQVCLVISNITSSNKANIGKVMESNIFQSLLEYIKKETDGNLQSHIVTAVWNIMKQGSDKQIHHITESGIVKALCNILSGENDKSFHVALCCLDRILNVSEEEAQRKGSMNSAALELETLGGVKAISFLLSHESEEVYLKAYDILERYFTYEEDLNTVSLEEMYTEYMCE